MLVTGGVISTPQNPKAINGVTYLKRMLKSKAAKRAADIIAIHPYSGAVRDIKKQFRLTREMLDRARLAGLRSGSPRSAGARGAATGIH